MATGEQPSPLKSKKLSSSSSQTRNNSEIPWIIIPNNMKLSVTTEPSKKQRNKEKHRQFQQGNLSPPSEVIDSVPCKPKSSFQSFPQAKSNTATWVKDQYINEKKCKRRVYESEEDSDPDYHQYHQQNVHFPANQTFPDVEHQENQAHPLPCGAENENIKSVQDEFKNKETARLSEILTFVKEFMSKTESSWQNRGLADEPIIKDAFVKLQNAVKEAESWQENKLLHHSVTENGYSSGMSPSSSVSTISNSKENIVNRDISGNAILSNEDEEQEKCNHHHEGKMSDDRSTIVSGVFEPLSSDDSFFDGVGERAAAVECERQKLKNKLVELKEEKKLLRELYSLKNATNSASASEDAQRKIEELRKRKLKKFQSVFFEANKLPKGVVHTGDNVNVTLDSDMPVFSVEPRLPHPSTSLKRDNVRKEQNSSFPARRHYEAEGRANEEPDVPTGPAPTLSPAPDNGDIDDKIRKLKVAQQHVKVIKDIVVSILESRKSGAAIPVDQLRLLTSKEKACQYFSDESEEGSNHDKEFTPTVEQQQVINSVVPGATNIKKVYSDEMFTVIDVDRPEEPQEVITLNFESGVGKKDDLTKLHGQFHQIMQIFPMSDRKNDDPVRSSGEGAHTLGKISTRNVVSDHAQKKHSLRTVPHQDNLQLTRQNIATMESQNSNLHNRDCNSVKKDNINNLSGKIGKLSIQNSMNSSYPDVLVASNNNMDSPSMFSYELNQSQSVPNEVERKNIFDILKRDKKKQKQYDRNQDNKVCCNSSIDSEPFEGSTSALAYDSTTLGAWGGSSTQENFDDDNEEQRESVEEQDQDEEEENLSVFEKVPPKVHQPTTQYSGQYANMQQYIDSVPNIPDKKQRNLHHSSYNRNQNQPTVQSGFHQRPSQEAKSARQRLSSATAHGASSREIRDNTACSNDTTEHCHQQLPTKFIQQLLSHVDQLNALCQNQIYHERPQAPINSHPSQIYGHVPNACAPLQPSLEIPFPYNQQLLLCLSQCYHALYMQQLEIHHLQRCMWQNAEGENSHQQNYFNARSGHEDTSFRPYCAPSWSNPFIPSSHFLPEQASPVSSAPYFHLPMKHYTNHNTGTYTGSGTQPARAVIHPTSQNNTASQETLNNQVPPRTRANNFWDNFRSYSRQNLLSTSNTAKRNENVAPLVTPQVRQVYPIVTNTSHNRSSDASNTCVSSSCSEYSRTPVNPEDTVAKNMKVNTPTVGAISSSKRDVPSNINSSLTRSLRSKFHRANPVEPSLVQPSSNYSSNLSQQQSLSPENPKSGSLNTDASNSASCLGQETSMTVAASTSQEITSMLSNVDHKSDFLIGLLHEAQALKSEGLRRKALRMIRDLAMSERHDMEDISQHKLQNDSVNTLAEFEKGPDPEGSNTHFSKISSENTLLLNDPVDVEKPFQFPSESSSGNIQTLPTAAIPPLSKHGIPKTVSTGAVRKKTKIVSSLTESSSGPASVHESSSNTTDSINPPTALPPNKTVEDIPGFITEKVIADLSAVLPSLKRRLLRDGCTQTFWTFINDCLLESLRTHLFFCNINLSRKSLLHLRQTVYLFLSLFSGITLNDMDSDFVKYVEEFIYENISCYIASGQFAPVPSSLDEENCHIEIEDKILDLCVKMPSEPTEPVSIKMPVRTHEDPSEPLSTKTHVKMQEESVESVAMKDSPVPSEESNFSPRCAPIQLHGIFDEHATKQNVLGIENFMPETLPTEQEHVEDLRCDCNPEAEIEPEVEIGTEADLAEADQSPGQQGSGGIGEAVPVPENWSLDHEIILHRSSGAILLLNGDESREIGDSSESAAGIQMRIDSCIDTEAILDDIPTKLCPSEEELPQQLKEEQSQQLSPDDAISQGELADNEEDNGLTTIR